MLQRNSQYSHNSFRFGWFSQRPRARQYTSTALPPLSLGNPVLPHLPAGITAFDRPTEQLTSVGEARASLDELEALLLTRGNEADRAYMIADDSMRLLHIKERERAELEAQLAISRAHPVALFSDGSENQIKFLEAENNRLSNQVKDLKKQLTSLQEDGVVRIRQLERKLQEKDARIQEFERQEEKDIRIKELERQLFLQCEDVTSKLTEINQTQPPHVASLSQACRRYLKLARIVKHLQSSSSKGDPKDLRPAASLGVIRLDYDYPAVPGDVDHPDSFTYNVIYRVVPGLTFEMCQRGDLPADVKEEFLHAVKYLCDEKGVSAITGDCGFMMNYQKMVRKMTHKPVFMSSLVQLPAVTCAYAKHELIGIFTANGKSLEPMHDLIKDECGVDTHENRYIIVGCEDVPGMEAVAFGHKVDYKKTEPGIVKRALETQAAHPNMRAILFECTEIPQFSDAVRHATGLPVYDAITCCNMFMEGMQDNALFGMQDWHEQWDGKQQEYTFGANLNEQQRLKLVNQIASLIEDI